MFPDILLRITDIYFRGLNMYHLANEYCESFSKIYNSEAHSGTKPHQRLVQDIRTRRLAVPSGTQQQRRYWSRLAYFLACDMMDW